MIKDAGRLDLLSRGIILATLLFTISVHAAGPAGGKLDGSVGGAAQILAGPTYNITQSLGKLSGGNLFYSFQYFNIGTGDRALFTTTSPGINNVISRVTGGYSSIIDGTISLQAAYGDPNFFLINPAGVTFTSHAAIDVPAAFYVATADYLKFNDGDFYVNPAKQSTFSAAAPEAFGFLGTTHAPVNLAGATLSAGPTGDGTAQFQIVAGDVTVDGEGGSAGISNTTGDVRVVTVGATMSEVPLSGAYRSAEGTLKIQNGGKLTTAGTAGTASGGIYIGTGSLTIDGTNAAVPTGIGASSGSSGAGPMTVDATGAVLLTNGGSMASATSSRGAGAEITLNAGTVTIIGASDVGLTGIASLSSSTGDGGDVRISTGTFEMNGSGKGTGSKFVGIENVASGSGSLGSVIVHAENISILNESLILTLDAMPLNHGGDVSLNGNSLSIDSGP